MPGDEKRENSFDDLLSFAQAHATHCGDWSGIMAAQLDELELAYVELEARLEQQAEMMAGINSQLGSYARSVERKLFALAEKTGEPFEPPAGFREMHDGETPDEILASLRGEG